MSKKESAGEILGCLVGGPLMMLFWAFMSAIPLVIAFFIIVAILKGCS